MRYSEREKSDLNPYINDIRGLWQQVRKETGLIDVRYNRSGSMLSVPTNREKIVPSYKTRVHEQYLYVTIFI